jgi:Trk K+ transport system NAD-binding subunit
VRQDVTIVGVIREGERMPPNGWLKLHPGDALIMQGAVPTIGSLLKSPDFQFMEEVKIGENTLRSLDLITVEALLSPNSRYTGRTMQQTNFGRDYGYSVLGISRHGQTIQERPSATRLEYAQSAFANSTPDFYTLRILDEMRSSAFCSAATQTPIPRRPQSSNAS